MWPLNIFDPFYQTFLWTLKFRKRKKSKEISEINQFSRSIWVCLCLCLHRENLLWIQVGTQLENSCWTFGDSGVSDWNVFNYVFLFCKMCMCWSQSGMGQTLVPCPDPSNWPASFALNSVASTWLGDNSGGFSSRWPLREEGEGGVGRAPNHPGGQSSHPHRRCFAPPFTNWLAPYLALRGDGVIPQELVAHLITVGNTWPFLQQEEDEEKGQKKEEEEEEEEEVTEGEQKRENKRGNMV